MSYSLKIVDGDLDTSTGLFSTVHGLDKLIQDLSMWLHEPLGADRFHPLYGSVLEQYIGSIIEPSSQHEIEIEVIRVLNAYQQIQLAAMKKNPSKYELEELLDVIDEVTIRLDYDAVYVNVRFTTASGAVGRVNGAVSL